MRNIPWLATTGVILYVLGHHAADLVLMGLNVVLYAVVIVLRLVLSAAHCENQDR